MIESEPRPPRHTDPTLVALEQLCATLNGNATNEEREGWWTLVLQVQASIDSDPRASKGDHVAMRRVREGVSEIYGALNRGHDPNFSIATRSVTSLRSLLESRTVGVDGYPLR